MKRYCVFLDSQINDRMELSCDEYYLAGEEYLFVIKDRPIASIPIKRVLIIVEKEHMSK